METLTTETFKTKIFDYSSGSNLNGNFKFIGTKPAIIDFYADWCGPCKVIAPILDELNNEYPGIDFYKVDTEESSDLAAAFGIRSIPTVIFIPVEGTPKMTSGSRPKESFKNQIKEFLGL